MRTFPDFSLFDALFLLSSLSILGYVVWYRLGVLGSVFTKHKINGCKMVTVKPTPTAVLAIESGFTLPVSFIDRIECSPRCVTLLTGPYLMAEIWLPTNLVVPVALRAKKLFPLAQLTHVVRYKERYFVRSMLPLYRLHSRWKLV